jgi:hypothetical protein
VKESNSRIWTQVLIGLFIKTSVIRGNRKPMETLPMERQRKGIFLDVNEFIICTYKLSSKSNRVRKSEETNDQKKHV